MASKKNIEENMDMANLSAKELSAMADALLASAEEDKPKKTRGRAKAKKAEEAAEVPQKTNEERLNELIEQGKKAGKLTSKELMAL